MSKDEAELNDLFRAVDKDNSSTIDWNEFLNLVHKLNWK
jgi:Ca2+-binding EF-hand superfamily protein